MAVQTIYRFGPIVVKINQLTSRNLCHENLLGISFGDCIVVCYKTTLPTVPVTVTSNTQETKLTFLTCKLLPRCFTL